MPLGLGQWRGRSGTKQRLHYLLPRRTSGIVSALLIGPGDSRGKARAVPRRCFRIEALWRGVTPPGPLGPGQGKAVRDGKEIEMRSRPTAKVSVDRKAQVLP